MLLAIQVIWVKLYCYAVVVRELRLMQPMLIHMYNCIHLAVIHSFRNLTEYIDFCDTIPR